MNQQKFYLNSKTIGVLPIVNYFQKRLRIRELLEK